MKKQSTIIVILVLMLLYSMTLAGQTERISNVSFAPNPFSPDGNGVRDDITIRFYLSSSGNVELKIGRDALYNDYTVNLNGSAGWNQFIWHGQNNAGVTLPDGRYGLRIIFADAQYTIEQGLIINTSPPEINILSSGPNPFSPNGDGFQDVHTVQYRVRDVNIKFIGLIEVDLTTDTAVFVEDPTGETGPHGILPYYSEGMYLFINRPLQYFGSISTPSSAQYTLTVGGTFSFDVDVTRGQDLYKIGHNYNPYTFVSPSIGMSETAEDINGIDYLALYGIEGNSSFNIFTNEGNVVSLNDLYPIHFGSFVDNPLDISDIDISTGRSYSVRVGMCEGAMEGTNLSDGRFIYRILVSNAVEHSTVESGEMLVNIYPLEIGGSVQPNRISPANQDGLFDQAVVQYQVSEDAFVTVKVWSLDKYLIRTLTANQLVLAEEGGYVLWDGKDDDGSFVAADSVETFILEITGRDRFIPDDVVSIQPTIVVDNHPPRSAVLFQPQPDSLSQTEVIITGITDEMNSDIFLFHNERNRGIIGQTGDYPGHFDFNVSLEEGNNSIYVKMRDNVANMGVKSNVVNLFLDSQPPQITIISPEEGQVFSDSTISVRANVTDSGVGVESVRFGFSLNGSTSLTWIAGSRIHSSVYGATYNIPQGVTDLNIEMYVEASDYLNNTVRTARPRSFQVLKLIPPETLFASVDAVYKVHLFWGDLSMRDGDARYRSVSYYQLYRMHNQSGSWDIIGRSETKTFVDNLLDRPDGEYTYQVKAAYFDPHNNNIIYSPGVFSNTVIVERFIDTVFNLSLADNSDASGIKLHLMSNDGLYNQEFVRISPASGTIQVPSVFKETYLLTLSKEGYPTIVDTIVIDTDNRIFEYELSGTENLFSYEADSHNLFRNFPNPFNPETEIRFSVKDDSIVNLTVYNTKGQEVVKLINNQQYNSGYHRTVWSGVNSAGVPVPSGIYFYRIVITNGNETFQKHKKMMMIK